MLINHIDPHTLPTIPVGTIEPLSSADTAIHRTHILAAMKEYVDNPLLEPTIVTSWLTEGGTMHPLHVDDHQNGAYVCIMWLDGDEECGGNLELWDPRWWNPKLYGGTYSDSKRVVKFKPGTIIIAPSLIWHSVTQYSGVKMRRSLNTIISTTDTASHAYNELVVGELYRLAETVDMDYDGSIESTYRLLSKIRGVK